MKLKHKLTEIYECKHCDFKGDILELAQHVIDEHYDIYNIYEFPSRIPALFENLTCIYCKNIFVKVKHSGTSRKFCSKICRRNYDQEYWNNLKYNVKLLTGRDIKRHICNITPEGRKRMSECARESIRSRILKSGFKRSDSELTLISKLTKLRLKVEYQK